MAYNGELHRRITECLKLFPKSVRAHFTEKKMFGGLAFLLKGKMTVGIIKDELVVRVLESKMDEVLKSANARPMDFTGKPMKEFVFIAPEGFKSEQQLHHFVSLGIEHATKKLKTD